MCKTRLEEAEREREIERMLERSNELRRHHEKLLARAKRWESRGQYRAAAGLLSKSNEMLSDEAKIQGKVELIRQTTIPAIQRMLIMRA